MISEEDLVNGKEKCYFQEKKCLTDIHNRTAMASKYVVNNDFLPPLSSNISRNKL